MEQTTINLRVPLELKEAFDIVAKEKDITASQMIRHYMRFEVERYKEKNEKGDK